MQDILALTPRSMPRRFWPKRGQIYGASPAAAWEPGLWRAWWAQHLLARSLGKVGRSPVSEVCLQQTMTVARRAGYFK